MFTGETIQRFRDRVADGLTHSCVVLVPTDTNGPGGVISTTYAEVPGATPLPCRLAMAGAADLERIAADRIVAPQLRRVVFAAGTAIASDARLHVTGDDDGITLDVTVDVVAAPGRHAHETQAVAIGRVVET